MDLEENGIILSPTAFKAAASDPDTLSFDQAMADIEHVTKWMEAAAKEVASLEKMEPGRKSVSLKLRLRFFQGLGYFGASDHLTEKSPSIRRATVLEVT